MPSPVTMSQMLQHPYVLGVFNRLNPAGLAFQQFYNMGAGTSATEPLNLNRHCVYDIFDNTRTRSQARAPMVGPAKIAPKAVGQSQATAMRLYESIPFPYEKVYGMRALGGQFGALDSAGQNWVARQIAFGAQRMSNAVEFMVSRMFRGGFSVTISGDEWTLGELSASGYSFNVDFGIPAGNKTTIGGIIDAEWDLAATKILNQMMELNKYSQLLTGYEIRHGWINSTTFEHMLANTQLTAVRGTAMRVFENYQRALIETNGAARNIGFTVTFPSMPMFTWHIYDGTSVNAQTDPAMGSNTTSTDSMFVPDGKAIFTPEPEMGGWHGMYHAAEVIKETDESAPTIKSGLSSWKVPTNHPPGEELAMLHNLTPLLYNPFACFYADVWS